MKVLPLLVRCLGLETRSINTGDALLIHRVEEMEVAYEQDVWRGFIPPDLLLRPVTLREARTPTRMEQSKLYPVYGDMRFVIADELKVIAPLTDGSNRIVSTLFHERDVVIAGND